MIYMNLSDEVEFNGLQIAEQMKDHGVLVDGENTRRFRLVTHCWIDDDAVDCVIDAFRKVLA
jgi:hypothetical protein